jgi:hypothetical protein
VVAGVPDQNELVQVYNRSPKGGDYVEHIYEELRDSDGRLYGRKPKKEWRAEAGAFAQVPRWLADKWKKQAPKVIVDSATVGAPSTGFQAPNDRVEKLEKDNGALLERIASLEAALKSRK